MNGIVVRDVRPEDTALIYDSWFKSWRKSKHAGVIPNNLYYKIMHLTVENLVKRGADIKVAVYKDRILGWVCYEFTGDNIPVIHYIYVKDPYFKYGVGELLRSTVIASNTKYSESAGPGFYTFKAPIVLKWFSDYRHVPEIARRKNI